MSAIRPDLSASVQYVRAWLKLVEKDPEYRDSLIAPGRFSNCRIDVEVWNEHFERVRGQEGIGFAGLFPEGKIPLSAMIDSILNIAHLNDRDRAMVFRPCRS
jgi:hypothetical protein